MKKWTLAGLILVALTACENVPTTTLSGSVSNTSMYASIFGIDDGASTTIVTQLRTTASLSTLPDISLESGDALYASNVGTTTDINQGTPSFGGTAQISEGVKQLQERNMVVNDFLQTTHAGAPEYATVFPQTNAAGTTYYVNFERSNYSSIENIPIIMATPFQLSTTIPGQINRSTTLQVSWTPSGDTTETMSYQTIYFCEDSLATQGASPITAMSNDTGMLSVDQSTLNLPNSNCTLTLVLFRQKFNPQSSIGSSFGLGATIKGVQRRYLNFYSTYP